MYKYDGAKKRRKRTESGSAADRGCLYRTASEQTTRVVGPIRQLGPQTRWRLRDRAMISTIRPSEGWATIWHGKHRRRDVDLGPDGSTRGKSPAVPEGPGTRDQKGTRQLSPLTSDSVIAAGPETIRASKQAASDAPVGMEQVSTVA